MKVVSGAFIAVAVIGLAAAAHAVPAGTAAGIPSFTESQATKGHSLYLANCALCHGANLDGVYAPALNGPDGNIQWQSVSDVYHYTSVQMPVGNAGGLSSDDYVDIMAFLLKVHGHHPGNTPLTASVAATSTALVGPR
ncbi:MAG: c-type cytochrome [Vulcanimicrobiaceae bacterium]